MQLTTLQVLAKVGQSVWLDNISRSMLDSGKLKEMIDLGLRGMTSNPTIFEKAIGQGNDYDEKIARLSGEGKLTFEIYDALTIRDIQDAADRFLPLYHGTDFLDGYVSLEVNPALAYDTQKTIQEGIRLCTKVNRPNVMFKVPATAEGFSAIEELLSLGINVNTTLIFSVQQYVHTANAYLRGIRRLSESGGDLHKVRSVASVFVSRIDTVVDTLLDDMISDVSEDHILEKLKLLKGKAAVANSHIIYRTYVDIFSSPQFRQLEERGAPLQRLLWGSTSTKNPAYSDIKYVAELIGKGTVNTIPENTLEAFLDHGEVRETLGVDISSAQQVIDELHKLGIEINEVCSQLLSDGVGAFQQSFGSLLQTIEAKQNK